MVRPLKNSLEALRHRRLRTVKITGALSHLGEGPMLQAWPRRRLCSRFRQLRSSAETLRWKRMAVQQGRQQKETDTQARSHQLSDSAKGTSSRTKLLGRPVEVK